jgi:hypothetical protein
LSTTARIRIKRNGANEYFATGSGTVVASDHRDALIVSCARIFKPVIPADKFDGYIVVDFPGERDMPPETDPPAPTDARLIDCDPDSDVALLRFHARRDLPVAPIVPRGWKPVPGAQMVSAGCNRGGAATLWSTTVLRLLMATTPSHGRPAQGSRDRIECLRAGEPGRTGGGLFTTDGQLAGVYTDPDLSTDTGLYAPPDAIFAILERNKLVGLTYLLGTSQMRPGAAAEAFSAPISELFVDDFHLALDQARAAHSAGDLNAYKSIIGSVAARLDDQISERREELKALEAKRSGLRRTPEEIFERFLDAVVHPPAPAAPSIGHSASTARPSSPRLEASKQGSGATDQAAKIRELDKKLDRVLDELERMKSNKR